MTNPSSGSRSAAPSWHDLEETCKAAIGVSRQIAAHLHRGAMACDFLPLLRHQADLADTVRDDIARLGGLGPGKRADGGRDRLLGCLLELLDMERDNQQMLARRGVRLTAA